jgi:hypothetical protein
VDSQTAAHPTPPNTKRSPLSSVPFPSRRHSCSSALASSSPSLSRPPLPARLPARRHHSGAEQRVDYHANRARVFGIVVDEIWGLTLLEASFLADALCGRLGVDQLGSSPRWPSSRAVPSRLLAALRDPGQPARRRRPRNLGRVSARSSLAAAATKGFGDVFDFLCPSSV